MSWRIPLYILGIVFVFGVCVYLIMDIVKTFKGNHNTDNMNTMDADTFLKIIENNGNKREEQNMSEVQVTYNGEPQMTKDEVADNLKDMLFGARAFEIFTAKERETLSRAIDLIEKDDSDTLSREAVLNLIAELNCTSFYEANDDSKETYYEIRDAIKNMSSGKTIKEETNVIS